MRKKSDRTEQAIILGAYRTFQDRGFTGTRMSDIALASGVTTSNIYNYYESKFALVYSLASQMFEARLKALAAEVRAIGDARQKIEHILRVLWIEIPREQSGLAGNLMEAIVTTPPDVAKPSALLMLCEERTAALLAESLPGAAGSPDTVRSLSHLIWMSFDGFTLNARRRADDQSVEAAIVTLTSIILSAFPAGR